MAESLRDLVVSLSLNTENFTRNIKSVNKQIQEAESYFKLAAAGIEGFENTTEGLTAKLSTLERRLQLQKDVVTQYERALAQATSKLTECYDRQTDYAQRLEQARQRQSALSTEVQNATGAYTRYRDSLGESNSATIAAKANMEAAQQEYEAATAEVNQLAGQQDALRKATQNAADAVSTQQTQLNKAQAAVRETETAIRGCNDALRLSQTNWQAAGDRMRNADTAVSSLGKQMQLAQSRFRLAAAGIREVDTNASALSAKLVMLNEKLTLQQQTVSRYEEKLQAAREQLIAAQQAHDPDKIREATDAVTDAETALTNAQAAVREIEASIREVNQHLNTAKSLWTAAGNSLTEFSKSCESVSKTTGAIGRVLSTYVTAPVLALGATAMKSSIEFESAFTGVRKTVDATETEFAQLEATVKQMSTEIAADTTEISNVMANAGQLGIRTDALEDFTRVMIDLGNTTDIVAEEAGSTLAKFANIMDMDQSLFENLGSTLVDFWYLEMNRATHVYAAYADNEFVGVLLAEVYGEKKVHQVWYEKIYVKAIDAIQKLFFRGGAGLYEDTVKAQLDHYLQQNKPDGEIIFLAADPDAKIKGIGSALLRSLEEQIPGKTVFLHTDDACTYQFYEHRGFQRVEEKDIVLEMPKGKVPLKCFVYSKKV